MLRYVNYAIAVALVALATIFYWILWRPLPPTSGTILTVVQERAIISRDSLGVPHIEASTLDDVFFAQGFATAQDRLWQMDAVRRAATGELAEVAGAAALESDRDSRRLRIARIAEEQERQLDPGERKVLAAYARGVNYFIERNGNNLPVEFTVLGYQPRPWRIADTLAIGLLMFKNMTNSWKTDLAKSAMLDGGSQQKVNQLFPARTGSETHPGSNAWVISAARTATGKPIVANDPHLEWGLPSTWYMTHLKAPGLNVTGVTLAGVPGIIIGHNENIAWGMTNLHYDVQDLYSETMNNAGQYVSQGQTQQAKVETELIKVKGMRPVEATQIVTGHGPIVLNDANRHYALRWIPAELPAFRYVFLRLNQARNWQEFQAVLKDYPGPAMNFVYGDTAGNIGYQVGGMLPIRKGFDGTEPVDGTSGKFEWQGIIPFSDLPSSYNPPSGMIVTANQNPFPAGSPYTISGNFAPYYRANQIEQRLNSRKTWKLEEMLAIQTDVYSPFSHFLAKQAVASIEKRRATNPAITDATRILKEWDGQMIEGKAAPLIVTYLFQHIRKVIADRASPGKAASYDFNIAPAVIEQLMRERSADWFPDWDLIILRALVDAVEEGQRNQGANVNKWDYGRYTEMSINHPILGRIPWAGPYFNTSTVPMRGSGTTVKQTSRRLGPSMRFIADLSNWDSSLNNITIGQSGQFLSSHYRDQWKDYLAGRSYPMQFTSVKASDVLILSPAGK